MAECKDCLHYEDELGCCYLLSDWSQPVLSPCIGSPCEHYVKGCFYCNAGNEKCGTCVSFFGSFEDGEGEECSSAYDCDKCVSYKPMPFCSMCGRRLGGGDE